MIAGFAALGRGGGRGGSSASTPRPSRPRPGTRSPGSPASPPTPIGLERDLRDDEIILDDRYHAGIYGIPDEPTLDAMRLAARTRGR